MSDLKIFPWAARPCFMSIPLDILQHILSWASPCDLQALRLVCRTLQNYIDFDCSMGVWRAALRNILFPVPAPTLHAWFKLSMLPALLFGGGKCMDCRRFTSTIPYSFALGIRFCSMACEFSALQRIPPTPKKAPSLPNALPGLEHRNTLPVPLPYLEGSSELHLYAPAQVSAAWSRFAEQYKESNVVAMPQVTPAPQLVDPTLEHWMATAELLCAGARQYRIAREDVDAQNETILLRLAQELGHPVKQLVSSPTLARWVNIFARDLQVFPRQAWKPIRDDVLSELKQRTSTNGSGIVCTFCPPPSGHPRRFSHEGLQRHITSCHPEQVAEPITDRFQRCRLCPTKKTKSYDRPSMLKHISALHFSN
ncbi:hypothetical protein FB451DRAFT_1322972 [Mycena latifolia]|nr:hypothetical protein FB451DRAFT_1322972 [Mycena latifolia]